MITVAELFPLWSTASKWLGVFREINPGEDVRLEKEYTIRTQFRRIEQWWIDEILHRTNGPASIGYFENGKIEDQGWYINGKLSRTDGPAHMRYYENGNIRLQDWFINGKHHKREEYFEDGNFKSQDWYMDGEFHRENGPARILYYKSGGVLTQGWYIRGKYVNPKMIVNGKMVHK